MHCQQNRRTCRRPECPGNQATFSCAPAVSFFSFSSTQWPLTETNHLIKHTVLLLYSLKYSISMAVNLLFSGLLLTEPLCVPLLWHRVENYIMENAGMTCRGQKDRKLHFLCGDGHRTRWKYYIPTRPRNIDTVKNSSCCHWQKWKKGQNKFKIIAMI